MTYNALLAYLSETLPMDLCFRCIGVIVGTIMVSTYLFTEEWTPVFYEAFPILLLITLSIIDWDRALPRSVKLMGLLQGLFVVVAIESMTFYFAR